MADLTAMRDFFGKSTQTNTSKIAKFFFLLLVSLTVGDDGTNTSGVRRFGPGSSANSSRRDPHKRTMAAPILSDRAKSGRVWHKSVSSPESEADARRRAWEPSVGDGGEGGYCPAEGRFSPYPSR